jgi:hypothetical protein
MSLLFKLTASILYITLNLGLIIQCLSRNIYLFILFFQICILRKLFSCTPSQVADHRPRLYIRVLYICILSHIATSLSLFFPSFVRLIDVLNTLLVFSTLLSLL